MEEKKEKEKKKKKKKKKKNPYLCIYLFKQLINQLIIN